MDSHRSPRNPGGASAAHRAWVLADALLLLAFLFSVVVQYNDPDPGRWMALYGMAALACGLSLSGRGSWAFPAALALVSVAWASGIAPHVLGRVPFPAMFESFEMKNLGVEESREMYGLLIVAAWMTVLAVRWARRTRAADGPPGTDATGDASGTGRRDAPETRP